MAKTGRRPHLDPPERTIFSLPSSLRAELDLIMLDPLTGRIKLGARTELATLLFRKALDAWKKGQSEVNFDDVIALLTEYAYEGD